MTLSPEINNIIYIVIIVIVINMASSNYIPRKKYKDVEKGKYIIRCYQCEYAKNFGRTRGHVDCVKFLNVTLHRLVNCTGHCQKYTLRLDADNYYIRRRCSNHCHDDTDLAASDHVTACCSEDKCNGCRNLTSQNGCLTLALLLMGIFLK